MLFITCWAVAAPPTKAGNYRFRTLNEAQGLNDLTLRDLAQDREGFIWIATHTGLYRYDGHRFRRYTSADGLAGDWVTDLAIDNQGVLWVAGAGGLSRRTGDGFQVVLAASDIARFSPGQGSPLVASLPGKVFVSTQSGIFEITRRDETVGISPVPPLQRRLLLSQASESVAAPAPVFAGEGNSVCALLPDSRLRCWDAATGALASEAPLPGDKRWTSAIATSDGSIYATTADNDVYERTRQEVEFHKLPLRYGGMGKLLMLADGTLCVPDRQGFWMLRGDAREHIDIGARVAGASPSSFLMDADGGFWIGTAGAGLVQWLGMRTWQSWDLNDGLPGATVSQVAFAPDGSQWIGTGQGLARRLPGQSHFTAVQSPTGPSNSPVFGLAVGTAGEIWFSDEPGVLRHIDPATGAFTRLDFSDDDSIGLICHLLWHEGSLWIADLQGISRLEKTNGRWQTRRVYPQAAERVTVYRMAFDEKGRLWAATQRGLAVLDRDQVEHIGVADGLLHQDVFGLSVAPHGNVVVHYRMPLGATLVRTLPGPALRVTTQHFHEEDGLASNKVYAVHADRMGHIWAGTENGLSVRNASGQWITFTQDDGLVWNDCSIGGLADEHARNSAGNPAIWIATSRGLSRFAPRDGLGHTPADVVVLGLRHGSQQTAERMRSGTLPSGRDFSIVYTAPRFTNQNLLRFRYRIDESTPWTETAERNASFASVGPGQYRFEVSVREPGGAWSEPPAAIEFRVPTPWWRQWWAISLAIWSLLAVARLVWRWRYKRMLSRQQELEQAVDERTKELQEQRVKAEAASRFKDQILANVSHEMRTPLNGILGFTDMVLGTNLTDEQREHLRTVQASGKTLVDIIEDLLDFAALESGQVELQRTPISLEEIIEQTLRSVQFEADRKGLTLSAHLDSGLPRQVQVDAHRLRQILLNLVGNAVKFSTQGHVRVTAGTLNRPSEGYESGWQHGEPLTATLIVSDEGPGIPPEQLDTVFEPFRQADGSLQRRHGGAGLGLAIVKRIVEAFSGHVRVQSQLGQGSQFVVSLPLNASSQPAASPPGSAQSMQPDATAHPASPSATETQALPAPTEEARVTLRKVLIAEDNPVNQTLLVKIMKARGLHVVAVGNGQAAVDAVAAEQFDLILMDIQMPVMDGIEATRLIRSRESGQQGRVPIIAVTANGLFQCRQECLEVGMDGYVVKPFGPATLFEAIENVSQAFVSVSPANASPAKSPPGTEGASTTSTPSSSGT